MKNENSALSVRLFEAADAVRGLAFLGLTTRRVHITGRNTVIELSGTPQGQLKGALVRMRGTAQGREYLMATSYQGCQVQWTRKGELTWTNQ